MAYPYRWPSGPANCAAEAFSQFAHLVDSQIGADSVACVVAEPIQGEGGFIVPADGFLRRVADFCRDRGILLVADEVQTGIARTGAWFACEHEGLIPDLITTAKGLAGGLPLAAVTGRADDHGRRPPRWNRRHVQRQPGRLRRRPGGVRRNRDPSAAGPGTGHR